MHVIITGSNAKLLSGELATHLSGRAKEIHLYPFSFAEYCIMNEDVSPTVVVSTDLANNFHIKSEHTVKNYVGYLRQAYMLIGINKYSPKSKMRITQKIMNGVLRFRIS